MSTRGQFTTMCPSGFSSALLVCSVLVSCVVAFGAQPSEKPGQHAVQPLEEVTVTARKQIDRSTLEHVIVPRFVESHGAPSARIGQVGRWYDDICPEVIGLQSLSSEFVARRIVEVARSVGAPTKRAGNCMPNVAIVFSSQPQEQLNYIASNARGYLGYSEHPQELGSFTHTIQAWYVTGTRSVDSAAPVLVDSHLSSCDRDSLNCLFGQAGSLLGSDLRSEFVYVTVIADAHALFEYRLQAVADYIATLVLTRTALDGCNPLPSIVDLLSADCGARARPQGITDADTAYLRALYSSNLELKVNFEKGEMRSRMLKSIEGP